MLFILVQIIVTLRKKWRIRSTPSGA